MAKKISIVQWLAWFYCANFLFIVTLSHLPGLTDAQGRLLGLFAIDPVDDIFHLLSGIVALVVALKSNAWSVIYFKFAGIPYGIDAITGIFFSVEFLNGDIFTKSLSAPNLGVHNLLVNGPHVLIPVSMLWIGFRLSKRMKTPE